MQVLKNYDKITIPHISEIINRNTTNDPNYIFLILFNGFQVKQLLNRYIEIIEILDLEHQLNNFRIISRIGLSYSKDITDLRGLININSSKNNIIRKITLIIEAIVDIRQSFNITFNEILREGYSEQQAFKKTFLDLLTQFKIKVNFINTLIPNFYIEAELKKKYPRNQKIVNELLEYIDYNTA